MQAPADLSPGGIDEGRAMMHIVHTSDAVDRARSDSSPDVPPRSLKLSESTPTLIQAPLTSTHSRPRLLQLDSGGALGSDTGVCDMARESLLNAFPYTLTRGLYVVCGPRAHRGGCGRPWWLPPTRHAPKRMTRRDVWVIVRPRNLFQP